MILYIIGAKNREKKVARELTFGSDVIVIAIKSATTMDNLNSPGIVFFCL